MAEEDELMRYLDGLPDRIRQPVARALQEQAAMLSEAQRDALRALETAPEDTGNLEESCTVLPGESDLEAIVAAGGDLTTKEVREGSGIAYDYAEAFEYGTQHQAARPFFWPTYREHRADIEEAIAGAVEEALR